MRLLVAFEKVSAQKHRFDPLQFVLFTLRVYDGCPEHVFLYWISIRQPQFHFLLKKNELKYSMHKFLNGLDPLCIFKWQS